MEARETSTRPVAAATGARRARSVAATLRARLVNPVVRCLLRTPLHRALSASVLLLSYTGRRTGVRRELPVMFAPLDDGYVVVAGQPGTKTWWRNFSGDARPVTVVRAGQRRRCRARLLEPGTEEHRRALDAYRQRYPRVPVEGAVPVVLLRPDHQF